ncbi:MAG: Gfo/Idh/MocA family oxidoreductase, partial [Boseongicola sp.]|nr:Gfo/Idh/MocA family oxidoreductase [Boseongicola sp.]
SKIGASAVALKLVVLGIDHGNIFGMLGNMTARGCTCAAYWTASDAVTESKFNATFPDVVKVNDRRRILDDPSIDLILISAVPADRAALAIEAMQAGKDVMVDKPGCTTLEQLNEIKKTVARTGRIWSVNFSERFQVPAVTKAEELVFGGAIGRVVQTVGLGPHKQNLKTRPDWFFDRERYGGILCDIASHQIDQFLWFTGSDDAEVMHAAAENTTRPDLPGFQDFGEVVLRSDQGRGYIRVDWFTPDGLPTWGDGRLFIQGTEGSIELRKYTDIGRPHVTDSLFLVNSGKNELIPCADVPLPYFDRLISDVQNRTETAAPQAHTFKVMELAITAQMKAEASAV